VVLNLLTHEFGKKKIVVSMMC